MTSSPEVDPPKPKQRPIIRLVIFIIAHSFLFCVACTVAGVVALLLLPVLANKTYVSENALMPGEMSPPSGLCMMIVKSEMEMEMLLEKQV
ncbi:glycosylphosphatidylinositol anchor attachment 1 protein [Tanacetum coccineum]